MFVLYYIYICTYLHLYLYIYVYICIINIYIYILYTLYISQVTGQVVWQVEPLQPPIAAVHPKLAVAISRKEWLCLTPVQSFESNVCAMRFKKVTSETPLGRCIFKKFREMKVWKALCVKKRATPRRGPSLVHQQLGSAVPRSHHHHGVHAWHHSRHPGRRKGCASQAWAGRKRQCWIDGR